jgi:hypothetical protein
MAPKPPEPTAVGGRCFASEFFGLLIFSSTVAQLGVKPQYITVVLIVILI